MGEICTREVVYVGRNESAARAARLMREHHVGSLAVLDPPEAGGKPAGVVTDRDIAVGVVALGIVSADDLLELVAEESSGLAGMVGREFRRERDEGLAAAV